MRTQRPRKIPTGAKTRTVEAEHRKQNTNNNKNGVNNTTNNSNKNVIIIIATSSSSSSSSDPPPPTTTRKTTTTTTTTTTTAVTAAAATAATIVVNLTTRRGTRMSLHAPLPTDQLTTRIFGRIDPPFSSGLHAVPLEHLPLLHSHLPVKPLRIRMAAAEVAGLVRVVIDTDLDFVIVRIRVGLF